MLVVIRGAGDLASGVAVRLYHAGFRIVMTDIEKPTAIRREVSFCRALFQKGEAWVEDVPSAFAKDVSSALALIKKDVVAVMNDPECKCIRQLKPAVLVDAILAKKNLGTQKSDADIVIALGPGFTAGVDCHAVVETMRGHDLGRVYLEGCALPNTGVPGNIGGHTRDRILRAPCDGMITPLVEIGALIKAGDTVAMVGNMPMVAAIDGVVRGLLLPGTIVTKGMKSGDVDPRMTVESCYTVSDKARAIGGGVLEAILRLSGGI